MTRKESIEIEGKMTQEKMGVMLYAAEVLKNTNLLAPQGEIGPREVEAVIMFLTQTAPITKENYRLHAHLRLTGTFARKVAENLGLNPFGLEVAGNLHDCGRLITHRYGRNDLLAEYFFKKIGLRGDVLEAMLPARICFNPYLYRDYRDLTIQQRLLAIADFCGKRRDDGGITSFEEVMANHLNTRRSKDNYANYIGREPLWPSEIRALESLGPDAVSNWANIFRDIKVWLQEQQGIDVEQLRQQILREENSCPNNKETLCGPDLMIQSIIKTGGKGAQL